MTVPRPGLRFETICGLMWDGPPVWICEQVAPCAVKRRTHLVNAAVRLLLSG